MWGLPPKKTVLCPICNTEHRGRCHFMRVRAHRKARVEETLRWIEARKERMKTFRMQRLIKELCDGIEEGRRIS